MGIVVIPKNLSKSGKNVCISLGYMDASNAKEGKTDNPYPFADPKMTGTYTNSKGVVTENVTVDCTTNYLISEMEGWNGRTAATYASKQITDFDNKQIGDVLLTRYQVSGQDRYKFAPSRAVAVTRKFTTFPYYGGSGTVVLISKPASLNSTKGYVSQYFYNPEYEFMNGDHYNEGFQDPTYPTHYWYNGCVEGSDSKYRIPSPLNEDMSYNKVWDTQGTLTSDFDGKHNTMDLVNDALNGVPNSNGELIKWDGTAEGLWKPYEVEMWADDCKTGYDVDGKNWSNTNYTKATSKVSWYYFPSTFNGGGSLMNYWNYSALTCHCYAPSGSGTHQGDWYLPASGECAFALAFAKEINDTVDFLKANGIGAVGLNRPVANNAGADKFCNDFAMSPYFIGNEYMTQIIYTSTAFNDTDMIDMYMGHASFYARHAAGAAKTRAFIQL